MPANGLICHIWDVSGVRIQCVSRVYPGLYPGCILGASLVHLLVHLGVSGCIQGAAGVYPAEESTGWPRASTPLQEIEVRCLEGSDTPQIHHIYTSGYTLDI